MTSLWLICAGLPAQAAPSDAFSGLYDGYKTTLPPAAEDVDCDVIQGRQTFTASFADREGFAMIVSQPTIMVFVHGLDVWSEQGRRSLQSLRADFAPMTAAIAPASDSATCYVSWSSLDGFLEADNALGAVLEALLTSAPAARRIGLHRTIAVVGFSSGGHLLKQAVVQLDDRGELSGLSEMDFITLGTPHRGTPLATEGMAAAAALGGLAGQFLNDRTLGPYAQALAKQSERLKAATGLGQLEPEAVNPGLAALNRRFLAASASIRLLNVCSADDFVSPPTACQLPSSVEQVMLHGPNHWNFTGASDPQVLKAVGDFVLRSRPKTASKP